jgi:acetyl/propionyl-CoA carboxylase alpha subunit/acetyl-CoA carboxylase carboxyltransferase component
MFKKILIANRGEIAIRIARACADLGLACVAVYSDDDAASLHVSLADSAVRLEGAGAAAYLSIDQLVAAAQRTGCDAVHPGYGFLSESAPFARRCREAGLVFVGPAEASLTLFGDKAQARAHAQSLGVPVMAGTDGPVSLEELQRFHASVAPAPIIIKAVSGGGGRGMRIVADAADLPAAWAVCRSEALASFGSDEVYAEKLVTRARHIEVQVIGDGTGRCLHVGERECTLQRRHQKLFEIAPSPTLAPAMRATLQDAALRMAEAANYLGLGTFEFLVNDADTTFAFMEANPRLQVEHTITEMVSGLDLVQLQLRVCAGQTLADIGLDQARAAQVSGCAVQLRLNMEVMDEQGGVRPSGGTLGVFSPPSGPGVRVDTFGYPGYTTNARFDSLLAKLVVHHPGGDHAGLLKRAERALGEFFIEGVETNKALLFGLLADPAVQRNAVHTRHVEEHAGALIAAGRLRHPQRRLPGQVARTELPGRAEVELPEDGLAITAPLQGTLISIDVEPGSVVRLGQVVAIIEAMKMQHVVEATVAGTVGEIAARVNDTLMQGELIATLQPSEADGGLADETRALDLDHVSPALAEVLERRQWTLDERRPDAVARRHGRGQRTARENVDDLLDADRRVEYGGFGLAQQRSRRSLDDLIRKTPADGLIVEVGTVNAAHFPTERARCMALVYDYTVLAGTQGRTSHEKLDRALTLCEKWKVPVVVFAEGGGGRAGEVDAQVVPRLQTSSFSKFARLSGLVPRVGIVSGYSFAGNAALLGTADVIIATENASFGMGGPAMIEGGGLGVVAAGDVGPTRTQCPNGVVDLLVKDEAAAVAAAKQYLGYFQGPLEDWQAQDQRVLRQLIPENRLRSYDIRKVISALADTDSVLELREQFGVGIVTAFARIEGKPFGIVANNPRHLGGAIDSDGADKASRFMQLCDAFDIPLIFLCDTPGFMVGPAAEATGLVRHVSRMFVTAANIDVPIFSVLLRKAYGLGAQAMTGGGFHETVFTVAWPTCEIGIMGFEGMVKLGHRAELDAITDPAEKKARIDALVAKEYEKGNALNAAAFAVLDDVIDPKDTRTWIASAMAAVPVAPRQGKKRPFVDTW